MEFDDSLNNQNTFRLSDINKEKGFILSVESSK
jgi:hypothetical protein